MGNKDFDFYLRPISQVIQVATVIKPATTPGGIFLVTSGIKRYMAKNPEIDSNITIGIESFRFNNPPNAPGISQTYPYPSSMFVSNTPFGLGIANRILCTFCDNEGTELFKKVPLTELLASNRKVKPYTGRICTFKSYFEVAPGGFQTDGNPIVVNLAFYLRK